MTDKEFLAGFKSECLHNVPEIRARDARLDEIAGKLKLLEKMVEVLRGVLEGEYITQEMEQQARDLIAEHGVREGGE
jgi:hypothetical protein